MSGHLRTGGPVGRDGELALLRSAIRNAARGRGGSVLVEGEPGIGKSALLAAGLADAHSLGCRLLHAVCDDWDSRFSLGALLEHERDRRHPPLPADRAHEARHPVRVTMELAPALVERMCAISPVALLLDDLQWVDDASLGDWQRLSRSAPDLPLLLVGACRPVPRRPALARLREDPGAGEVTVVRLAPLSAQHVEDLVRTLVGATPGPRLRGLADLAGGNPRYVTDIVASLRRDGLIDVDGSGTAELVGAVGDGALPGSLASVVVDRLGFLAENTTQILRIAALLGTEVATTEVVASAGMPAATAADGVREACAAGVLTDSCASPAAVGRPEPFPGLPDRVAFRQPLVRQALCDAIPAGLRSALHRHLAEALASSGAPLGRVAGQLLAAPDAVDGWTTSWLVAHAPDLIRSTPRTAATLLQRTLEHLPARDSRRAPTEVTLSTALRRLARFKDLERLTRRALADPCSTSHRARMTWLQAFAMMHIEPDEALNIVANPIGGEVDRQWDARLAGLRALILGVAGRLAEVRAAAEQALELARQVDDRVAVGYSLYAMAFLESRVDPDRAVDLTARALAAAGHDLETTELRLILLRDQTRAFDRLGMRAEAETAVRATLELAERLSPRELVQVHLQTAEHWFDIGEWDRAVDALGAVEEEPEGSYVPVRLHGLSALIAGHRDDRAAARRHLDKLPQRPIPAAMVGEYGEYFVRAQALAAERSGQLERAMEILARQLGPRPRLDVRLGCYGLPSLVRLALAVGNGFIADAAGKAAEADAALSTRSGKRAAMAMHCRGLLASDPALLHDATRYFRDAEDPLELAAALEDAAAVHGARAETADGRAAFTEAAAVYIRLGASWDLRRAESRLRPYGIGRGRRGPRRRPAVGWEALTPTERTVAELVSQGRSNPDIAVDLYLSRRTVQTHVSHILAKLGIRSREEVAHVRARWAASGPDDGR